MNDAAKLVGEYVSGKILKLRDTGQESSTKALLAHLRRGIGKTPGSMPQLWEITFDGLPDTIAGQGEKPSYGEWAIHIALTLFALHQQGKDTKQQSMFSLGQTLGKATRGLVQDEDDEPRIKRRFDAIATSQSMEEIAHHLRGIVQLLRANDIPLDYSSLAVDLFRFQMAGARDSVRLKWGQDFYRVRQEKTSDKE